MIDDIAVIVPSLNPDDKLLATIKGIIDAGFSKIVLVNDGSDNEHQKFFDEAVKNKEVVYLKHEINKGKGAALKYAFSYIADNMPEVIGAITADGDGQHTPLDIRSMAELMIANPECIYLGCRNLKADNVPKRSVIGNTSVSLAFKLFFGIKLSDTQTGMRGIPAKYLKEFANEIYGDRYDYEAHMLVHISNNRYQYEEMTIETVYFDENAGSHYSTFKDSFRIAKVFFRYSSFLKQIISSIVCSVVDLVVFLMLSKAVNLTDVKQEIFIATVSARICSSTLNYVLNRKFVFRSHAKVGPSIVKYILVASSVMLLSWGGVSLLSMYVITDKSKRLIPKLIIDFTLFILSYFVQKIWVFSSKKA